MTIKAFALPVDAHHAMHAGLAYWRSAQPAPELLPGRQHIDPLQMKRLLPYAWLLEVHAAAPGMDIPRFRFRLVGSHVDLGFGAPKTGRWLDEIEPDFNSNRAMQAAFVACAKTAEIAHRRGLPRFKFNREAAELERMMLPLASNGRKVDMLLGFTVFYDHEGRELRTTL